MWTRGGLHLLRAGSLDESRVHRASLFARVGAVSRDQAVGGLAMMSPLLALSLAGAMQSDAANQARRDYSSCLRTFMRASLEQRMEPAAFETAMASQCTA